MSKRYRGISDSQANAEALVRRSAPYSTTHAASMEASWHYENRIPDDLRGLVRAARRAYADEVPTKLHEGPDNVGEGGTPKMAGAFATYLDEPQADDDRRSCISAGMKASRKPCKPDDETGRIIHIEACQRHPSHRPLVKYHVTPFRATLDRMQNSSGHRSARAAIVRRITIGGMEPDEAAIAVIKAAPELFARLVAEDALRVFFGAYSDVKLDLHRETEAA